MPENHVALPVCEPGAGVGVTVGVVPGVGDIPGVAVGVIPGVAVGVIPGVAVGVVPGVGVTPVPPLQVLPLTVKLVGAGLLPVHVPLKPGVAEPLAGILPFQLAFVTMTFCPDWVNAPFQPCVTA